jgi:hypothetical protein
MKKDEVPQQAAKAFMGRTKALYALDENGQYKIVPSAGWEAEEIVLDQAIAEYEQQLAEVLPKVKAGQASTLEYHMYKCRMDVLLLAQSSGFFQWQVRRHLRPEIYAKLSESKKMRYAEALGLSLAELDSLPEGL